MAEQDAEVWKLSLTTTDIEAMDEALEQYEALAIGWDNKKEAARVDAYFSTRPEINPDTLPPHTDFICAPVPPQDWVAYGQKSLPEIYVPPFLVHGGHNRPTTRGSYHTIEIEAAQAFGTGHHATTQHCLALLAYHFRTHSPALARVADIGCGAGILSIAAAKIGVRTLYASDNDPLAVAATKENARHNRTAPAIETLLCSGMKHPDYICAPTFDLIMANILATPLRLLAKEFAELLAYNGCLILSGILQSQARRVQAHYRQFGFVPKKIIHNDGWTSLYLTR